MKYRLFIAAVLMTAGLVATPMVQAQSGQNGDDPIQHSWHFVDGNGDGLNDNAPDFDGDGIPNGMDEDYQPQGMGNGYRAGGFVDADGDGINDRMFNARRGPHTGNSRMGYGPGNGAGYGFSGPQDGSGYGPGGASGDCDGTGPKGFRGKNGPGRS